MNKLNFTLLDYEDAFGLNNLYILNRYGTRAAITDFAILLGGGVSEYHTVEGGSLMDRTGCYFTKTHYGRKDVYTINYDGISKGENVVSREFSVRPVIEYSSISDISSNKRNDIIATVEFGEYPQMAAREDVCDDLEELYLKGKIKKTGKVYTTDSTNNYADAMPFRGRRHIELVYEGHKYIRVLPNFSSVGEILSNRAEIEEEKPYWIKVEPIVWMIDKEKNKAISKRLLFAGVQFCDKENYKGDFENTRLNWFLDNYFRKDIIPSKIESVRKVSDESPLFSVSFKSDQSVKFPAYFTENGRLRELYTNIALVSEYVTYYPEDALVYDFIRTANNRESQLYIKNKIEIDTQEYLNYLRQLCTLGNNDELIKLYEGEYEYRLSLKNK